MLLLPLRSLKLWQRERKILIHNMYPYGMSLQGIRANNFCESSFVKRQGEKVYVDFLFSHHILICSFTSVSYFRECELYLGIPDTHIRYFPCQNHHLGDIIMFFCTRFYLLVKEMSEWIYVPSRAARVGWTSCTHSPLTDADRHWRFKTAYLSPSIFTYKMPCRKYMPWSGQRLGET